MKVRIERVADGGFTIIVEGNGERTTMYAKDTCELHDILELLGV